MRFQLDVVAWRGGIPESRHRLQAAVVDATGRTTAGSSDADLLTTFRSAAKPFQLVPLVERGHADRWGFGDAELAIMSASHTGSPEHVALVAKILKTIGLTERHLACGYHDPVDPTSLAHVQAHPEARTAIYNNCSGKHAGMLALALSEGWPVAGYHLEPHPLQQLMLRTVSECCGIEAQRVAVAIDGCSVCVFGLSLKAMARGYAVLAGARAEGDVRERALARIRAAMTAHPRLVGGAGRFGTTLMERTGGRMVVKGGAEGLECVGLSDPMLGLAVKCEDGNPRALAPATLALLEHLGELSGDELSGLKTFHHTPITNAAGLEVGTLEAELKPLGVLLF